MVKMLNKEKESLTGIKDQSDKLLRVTQTVFSEQDNI